MSKKEKFALYLTPEKKARLERRYQEDGSRSITGFIERAIDFYLDYLSANNAGLFLPTSIQSYLDGTFTEEKKAAWDERLKTVFNRGFWNGYYLGQRLGEWSEVYGSKATKKKICIRNYGSEATERKVYAGRGIKYFSNLGVAEFLIEAAEIKVGDKLLITGPTTGAMYVTLEEARVDLKPVDVVKKGVHVSFKVPDRVRPSDKLYRVVPAEELKNKQ